MIGGENWHLLTTALFRHIKSGGSWVPSAQKDLGPSGVRALPLAAGINVGGHYKWHFFLLLSLSSGLIANSPRRGCRRVPKSCMCPLTHKNIMIPINNKQSSKRETSHCPHVSNSPDRPGTSGEYMSSLHTNECLVLNIGLILPFASLKDQLMS